jgi:hypothetical protein
VLFLGFAAGLLAAAAAAAAAAAGTGMVSAVVGRKKKPPTHSELAPHNLCSFLTETGNMKILNVYLLSQ